VHKNRRGYGRWLTFLANRGVDLAGDPAARVTEARLRAYLAELCKQGVKPYTLRNRFLELYATLKALAPDRDWRWLRTVVGSLDRDAIREADRSAPPILAGTILRRTRNALDALAQNPVNGKTAVAYRNTLMILLLAILPLRLRNFAALSLSRHLRCVDGIWQVDIGGNETKTDRPFAGSIPGEYGWYLDHYLEAVRPWFGLQKSNEGEQPLWVRSGGRPLAEHTIRLTVMRETGQLLGHRINPHQFRHIFATTVSMVETKTIEGARAALGHGTDRTTRHHYDRARNLDASRVHGQTIARLRRGS
jgi:integrase